MTHHTNDNTKTIYCVDYFSVAQGKNVTVKYNSIEEVENDGWDAGEAYTIEEPIV